MYDSFGEKVVVQFLESILFSLCYVLFMLYISRVEICYESLLVVGFPHTIMLAAVVQVKYS